MADDTWLRVDEASKRIGVSREVLLSWERRHGFPQPGRLPNGHRCYSGEMIAALALVPVRRDSGIPLVQALAEARESLRTTARSDLGSLPAEAFRAVLDRLDVAVSIISGPSQVIVFTNAAHQRMYPQRLLTGQLAIKALTHSHFFELSRIFEHVTATGSEVAWQEVIVPHFGEDRWWNFKYVRLPLSPDQPVRLALIARDITEDVLARKRADATIKVATESAIEAIEGSNYFDILARLSERALEGGRPDDPELLGILLRGIEAGAVSFWTAQNQMWRRTVAVGGGHSLLPGHERDIEVAQHNPGISRALESDVVVHIPAQEFWPNYGASPDESVLIVPVTRQSSPSSRSFILIENPPQPVAHSLHRFLRVAKHLIAT